MLCHVAVAVQIHLLSLRLTVQKSPWTAGLFPQTFLPRFHTQTLKYTNLHSFNTPVFGLKRMFIHSVWLDLTTHTPVFHLGSVVFLCCCPTTGLCMQLGIGEGELDQYGIHGTVSQPQSGQADSHTHTDTASVNPGYTCRLTKLHFRNY